MVIIYTKKIFSVIDPSIVTLNELILVLSLDSLICRPKHWIITVEKLSASNNSTSFPFKSLDVRFLCLVLRPSVTHSTTVNDIYRI